MLIINFEESLSGIDYVHLVFVISQPKLGGLEQFSFSAAIPALTASSANVSVKE